MQEGHVAQMSLPRHLSLWPKRERKWPLPLANLIIRSPPSLATKLEESKKGNKKPHFLFGGRGVPFFILTVFKRDISPHLTTNSVDSGSNSRIPGKIWLMTAFSPRIFLSYLKKRNWTLGLYSRNNWIDGIWYRTREKKGGDTERTWVSLQSSKAKRDSLELAG